MSRWRVLVTRHVYPAALELLRPHVELTYHDSRDGLEPEQLRAAVALQDAVICQLTDGIDASVIEAGKSLKVIANVAVGYDNIDVAAAHRRGIVVTHTPGVLTESTADLTFALILATARRLPEAERFLRDGRWRQWEIDLLTGQDVGGRTLGILGMGRIGRAVAKRAGGFGMRVLYHSRSPVEVAGAEARSLESLLTESDFVSVHVPLTDDTRHMISIREFERMQPTAILINTARGPIVDEDALLAALQNRTIHAAGLDVFATEPDFDRRFLDLGNAVLLPHIGSASVSTRTRMCCMAAENVTAAARGETPPNALRE